MNRPQYHNKSGRVMLTVQDVHEDYRIGTTKIYELIKEGKLRTVAVGGRRLIHAESLHALLGITEDTAA